MISLSDVVGSVSNILSAVTLLTILEEGISLLFYRIRLALKEESEIKEQGRQEAYQEVSDWNSRRLEAEARGETFTEPPPGHDFLKPKKMHNRLKQLPLNVQKRLYEIAGFAGTNCPDFNATEYNHAMGAFLFATDEELQDFLYDHARYNLEHRISWHDAMQEVYRTPRQKSVYNAYLRSPEWQRKRQAVLNRAMRSYLPESPEIRRTRDRYGRLIESIAMDWKPICEREDCSNVAKQVHHWNYDRVGKEQIGMEPEASEENDLIALCPKCHVSLHAGGKIIG